MLIWFGQERQISDCCRCQTDKMSVKWRAGSQRAFHWESVSVGWRRRCYHAGLTNQQLCFLEGGVELKHQKHHDATLNNQLPTCAAKRGWLPRGLARNTSCVSHRRRERISSSIRSPRPETHNEEEEVVWGGKTKGFILRVSVRACESNLSLSHTKTNLVFGCRGHSPPSVITEREGRGST